MANELGLGARRVGDFADFNPDTPPVKVVLEHSTRGIGLTLSWTNVDDPYASWFLREERGVRAVPSFEGPPVPTRVAFQDSYGAVLLTGCHASSFHTIIRGPGSGTLWSRAAIMGVKDDVDFESPHGLESDISGLRAWVGSTSWDDTTVYEYASKETVIRSLEVPDIEIGEYQGNQLALRFGRDVRREEGGDRIVLTDFARCVTRSESSMPWDEHLKLHGAIRDLLVISRWQDESCRVVNVMRLDDPLTSVDGKTRGERWREVVIPDSDSPTSSKRRRNHLLTYEELSVDGILRWVALRDEFSRALDPVITSIKLHETSANTFLAHTGPGLEALGYLLMLRDRASAAKARKATLRERLERILQDLGDCLPFDSNQWVTSTCDAYNGLKHANRDEPNWLDVLNAWRECVLVVRAWVAVELGVPRDALQLRLSVDPQRHPFEEAG